MCVRPPNEMQISCKRPLITYVPYRLMEDGRSAELRPVRVCRLHLRVRLRHSPASRARAGTALSTAEAASYRRRVAPAAPPDTVDLPPGGAQASPRSRRPAAERT